MEHTSECVRAENRSTVFGILARRTHGFGGRSADAIDAKKCKDCWGGLYEGVTRQQKKPCAAQIAIR